MEESSQARLVFSHPILRRVALALIFALAIGVRMMDLTDLPLDINPTRQLFSALKARGMYLQDAPDIPEWQREMSLQQWKAQSTIEPEILETLVAWTYRLTGPELWVARLYSVLFWTLGGLALYALVKQLTGPDGAILALVFHLFLPYGIFTSRSFQPDPLMVALVAGFLWAFERWSRLRTWRWAVIAGLLGGCAILVKTTAVFFVGGAWLGIILGMGNLKITVRDARFWLLNGLIALPTVAYTIYGFFIGGYLGGQLSGRFIPSLLVSPLYYLNWEAQINTAMGFIPLALALLGLLSFLRSKMRGLLLGLWGGYLMYGLVFNYHISTHTYYQLPLIPLVAITLAPMAGMVTTHLLALWKDSRWVHVVVIAALTFSVLAVSWDVRRTLRRVDYRSQAEFWDAVGQKIGHNTSVVGITEDYSYRAAYWGWINIHPWPSLDDQAYHVLSGGSGEKFASLFTEHATGKELFLITDFNELAGQTELAAYLDENYPLYASGDGYLIYDLGGDQ